MNNYTEYADFGTIHCSFEITSPLQSIHCLCSLSLIAARILSVRRHSGVCFCWPPRSICRRFITKGAGQKKKKKKKVKRAAGRRCLEEDLHQTQENKTTSSGINDLCLYQASTNSPSVDQTGPPGFNKPSYINGHKQPLVVEESLRMEGEREKERRGEYAFMSPQH